MALIRLHNVTRQFGTQVVLEDLSLELHPGEKVGLVGPNGAGKTTLFRVIAGLLAPDLGTVTRAKGLEIGYLPQEPQIDPQRTLLDEVADAFTDLLAKERRLHDLADRIAADHDGPDGERLMQQYDRLSAEFATDGGYTWEARLGEILGGVGFSPAEYEQSVATLSGGQKCRAALAKLLLQDSTFLLLDEPTNHLDIDAVRWLEKFLAGHTGGAVIISHDRYFLDRLADRIIELEDRRIRSYAGNYSAYVQAKALRTLTLGRQYEKDREFIEKEQAFIAKHLAGQRSQEAKGRRTRLQRRLEAGEFVVEKSRSSAKVRFELEDTGGRSGTLLRVDDLSKAFGEKRLFEGLNLRVALGDRLGITGPNGSGKSTLLRILLGQLEPDRGRVDFDRKAQIGYYAQETTDLPSDATILDEVRALRPDWSAERVRGLLGAFCFRGDDVFKPLGKLSGGEQSRVRLVKLILSAPEVLVLDEPTNHLDIASREALEGALADFGGTIITVSHDRYFLDQVVSDLLVLRPEGHTLFRGNYSDYVRSLESREGDGHLPPASGEAGVEGLSRPGKRTDRRSVPSTPSNRDGRAKEKAKYDRCSVEEIKKLLAQHEQRVGELNNRFGDPRLYQQPNAVTRLHEELQAAEYERAILEDAWLERLEHQ